MAPVAHTDLRRDLAIIITSIGTVVGWILVICGWFFVSRDQNWREHRREIRDLICQIADRCHLIEEHAQKYLILPGAHPEAILLGATVKREIERVRSDLRRLQVTWKGVTYNQELIEFRRTVTGGDFEVRSRAALASDSTRVFEASTSADPLLTALEQQFSEEFENNRWFPWRRPNKKRSHSTNA